MSSQPDAPPQDHRPAFARRPPAITILSDHASQDRDRSHHATNDEAYAADRDHLKLEHRLSSIFDILRHQNTRCPLTIAIYGDWGSGKTSAMRWLETRLHDWNTTPEDARMGHPRVHPVWFDPWRYQTKEEVWRGIIAEVILALFQTKSLDQENIVPRMVQAAKKFGAFLGRGFLSALAGLKFEAGGKMGVPGVADGSVKLSASGDMFRDIWEEYNKATHPEKAHLNQFEQVLREWVNDFLYERPKGQSVPLFSTREHARLAIFIDDLDRCLPEVTLEVLEALKLYLNIPGLIFVVGLDDHVVRSVVTDRYKKAGVEEKKSLRYLDKLFQVEYRIEVSAQRMPDFMREQIDVLDKATGRHWSRILDSTQWRAALEDNLVLLAGNNPRTIKRLLNTALLRGQAAWLDHTLPPQTQSSPQDERTLDQEAKDRPLENQRFAHGVQVFIVQTWLQDHFLDARDWLHQDSTLLWLEETQQLIAQFQLSYHGTFESLSQDLLHIEQDRQTSSSLEPAVASAEPVMVNFVRSEKPTKPTDSRRKPTFAGPDPTSLNVQLRLAPAYPDSPHWRSESFLHVMQVPFVKAIAEHFPPPVRSQDTISPSTGIIEQIPDFVRQHLASTAGVPLDALTPEKLSGIQHLDLSGFLITSRDLGQLAKGLAVSQLSLSGCTGLTDLSGLGRLRSLGRLSLSKCTGLQGAGVLEELSGLDRLQHLDLDGCTGLTDLRGVGRLRSLVVLDLRNCTGLQGAEVLEELAGLDRLQHLDINGCTGITREHAEAFYRWVSKQRRPEGRKLSIVMP